MLETILANTVLFFGLAAFATMAIAPIFAGADEVQAAGLVKTDNQ